MVVLDCESLDSTYDSVQSIFGLTRQAIDHVFASLDVERFYSENRGYPHDAPHLLFERIRAESRSPIQFDAVCWFHLSRVLSAHSFENGILPLGDQVDSIWNVLRGLVGRRSSDSEWAAFREKMGDSHSAFLYHMKLNDRDHWGPYGMLVRDVAFSQTNLGSHYLTIPEIIEDISLCFAEQFGFDLRSAYIQNSQPCIVKFIVENPYPRCLPPALYYLFSRFHGESLSLSCNTCFDGGGNPVGPQQILRIEVPELLAVAS
jgi:hypothetical protein